MRMTHLSQTIRTPHIVRKGGRSQAQTDTQQASCVPDNSPDKVLRSQAQIQSQQASCVPDNLPDKLKNLPDKAKYVRPDFKVGDMVKIRTGRYQSMTAPIVGVNPDGTYDVRHKRWQIDRTYRSEDLEVVDRE
jgi:transcription antitermination factor NusG